MSRATSSQPGLPWLATQTDATGEIAPMALALFMDYLPTPVAARQALLAVAPGPTSNPVTDNMLAALAETIADETALPVPAWCADVAPLPEPLPTDGTPRMLANQRATALPRFVARGITMPRASLFRDRPPMDQRDARIRAGLVGVAAYEEENGAFTADELAAAEAWLDPSTKRAGP